jgi:hypothetical protein
MPHRAAVIAAAVLAPIGVSISLPVIAPEGGAQAALAAGVPSDPLIDENNPPKPKSAQAPARTPVPPPASAPGPAAAAPPTAAESPPTTVPPKPVPAPAYPRARIALPPKPADTLSESRPPKGPRGPSRVAVSPRGSEAKALVTAAVPQTTATAEDSASPVAEVSTVPTGPVQAGGGGSAGLHDISPEALVVTAAVLAVAAAASGLALRRRRAASRLSYHARSRAC